MYANTTAQLKSTIPSISIMQLGSHWRASIDSAGRNGLALHSDIGDQLFHIWCSRKEVWHIDTQAYPTQKECMATAIRHVHKEVIRIAERLAFFQVTSADVKCLLHCSGVFPLRSIDRTVFELALAEILTTHIENRSFANILPLEKNKKRNHEPRVVRVEIPHALRGGMCRLKALPIKVILEVYDINQKKFLLEPHSIRNLTDGAINEFTAKMLYRELQLNTCAHSAYQSPTMTS